MVAINENDFIKEAIFCIKENDFIKSKALFFYFPEISAPFQNRLLYEISKAPDEMAYKLIQHISGLKITNENVRAKLYEVILDKSYRSSEFVLKLIKTDSAENKKVILKVVRNLKLKTAVPDLLDMLGKETDVILLQDTLKTMSKIGDDSCLSAMSDFVFYGDPDLKSTAVLSLAEIGTQKALDVLIRISTTSKVDQLILDTIESLTQLLSQEEEEEKEEAVIDLPESKDVLQATVESGKVVSKEKETKLSIRKQLIKMLQADDFQSRYLAIEQLMGSNIIKEKRLIELFETDNIDVKLNILQLLDFINTENVIDTIKKFFYSNPEDVNLRFAIYDTIKNISQFKSVISVIDGLEDKNELVRMAASSAINESLSDVHIEGIKSKIETVGDTSRKIVEAIVDSKSINIFEALMGSDAFMNRAINHLSRDVHPAIRNYFINYLTERGNASKAGSIGEIIAEFDTKRPVIFMVHGSTTVQNYYNKILCKFFNVFSFSTPEEAMMKLLHNIPDLLITDLYLDDIDGISFANLFQSLFEKNSPNVMMMSNRVESALVKENSYDFFNLSLTPIAIIEKIKKVVGNETQSMQRELFITGINQLIKSSFVNLRPIGISLLEKTKTDVVGLLTKNFNSKNNFLISKSLDILSKVGKMGDKKLAEIFSEMTVKSTSALVRSSAYDAIGRLLFYKDNISIAQIFKEKNYNARLSAVQYIDKFVDDKIIMELKNLTETSSNMSKDIVSAIVDSYSFNIFNKLIKFDTFAELATFHLSQNVHQTTRDFFLDKLRAQRLNRMARSIQNDVHVSSSDDENIIFILSDSKVRVSILTSLLNNPFLSLIPMKNFEEAMDMIMMVNPVLIISDLCIAGNSVLRHLRKIRRDLGENSPPVAVITSVENFQGFACLDQSKRVSHDNLNCFGIKKVFARPMDINKIKSYVAGVVK